MGGFGGFRDNKFVLVWRVSRHDLRNPRFFRLVVPDIAGDALPMSVFWAYVHVAQVPMENLWNDDSDLWFGFRVN